MNKFVSLDKRSKKARREYHTKQRRTWGEINPVTRSVPSGKTYNRKKEKQKIGKEFRNGFDADFLFLLLMNLDKLALLWNSNADLHELSKLEHKKLQRVFLIDTISDK